MRVEVDGASCSSFNDLTTTTDAELLRTTDCLLWRRRLDAREKFEESAKQEIAMPAASYFMLQTLLPSTTATSKN